MTESALLLVDTNVLLDVSEQDEAWADWSQEQMSRHVDRMLINPLIYSELCYEAGAVADVNALMLTLGLRYAELPRQALFLAAQAYKCYRKRGGVKNSPLPDFFIGAHAAALDIPILTRDVSCYRTYFPDLTLIAP
jgi:hypothetical protein